MRTQAPYGSYKRNKGRSKGSYTQSVSQKAKEKRKTVLNATFKLVLLCVILPPVGLYMIWSNDVDNPVARLAASVIACAIMVFWFTKLIPDGTPEVYQFTKSAPTAVTEYSYGAE